MELTKHFLFFIKKKPTTHVEFVMWDGDRRNPCECTAGHLALLRTHRLSQVLPVLFADPLSQKKSVEWLVLLKS